MADLATWLPMPLVDVGTLLNKRKLDGDVREKRGRSLAEHCIRDAEIVFEAIDLILDYIEQEDLGNWQPTGAGMAYATWRHKYMSHKVLVHDDAKALAVERAAMHTGRAEAWRHGNCSGDTWHEVDMRSAYTRIAAECDLPTKLKFTTGPINVRQYEELSKRYRVLLVCTVTTDVPVVPYHNGERTIWPVGKFNTVLWDVEADLALGEGAKITIAEARCYTRHPILAEWGTWALRVINATDSEIHPVIRAWVKHCGRALIGRLSLRSSTWEEYGENPEGMTGISYIVDYETGHTQRMMHLGNQTLIETDRIEGHDSLPQITGWIMAECRVRLYCAMEAAGHENIAHIDTDSTLVNSEGLRRMRVAYGPSFGVIWHIKAHFGSLHVYGPRNIRAGRQRKVAGIPVKAVETEENVFVGELWAGAAADISRGRSGAVTIRTGEWRTRAKDPRRVGLPGVDGGTRAIRVG